MERTLQKVIMIFRGREDEQTIKLSERLNAAGIVWELHTPDAFTGSRCAERTKTGEAEEAKDAEEADTDGAGRQIREDSDWFLHTVIITDDRALARQFSKRRFVCIGLQRQECLTDGCGAACENGFFAGAALVTDSLEELDEEILEECLLHMTGRPVTAAETSQLILREMTAEDAPRLYEISTQAGMEKALAGGPEQNFFRQDSFLSYINCAYRFFGFGLWSVLKRDGTLIGCCGFSYWEDRIELQYMLDETYRGKGYGTQMCRAALSYAALRTDWERIYVRIAPDNRPSLRLAEKLGFQKIKKQAEAQDTDIQAKVQKADIQPEVQKADIQPEAQKADIQPEAQNATAQAGNCLQWDYIVLEYKLAKE